VCVVVSVFCMHGSIYEKLERERERNYIIEKKLRKIYTYNIYRERGERSNFFFKYTLKSKIKSIILFTYV